jgi:mannose-1-phosphate guanylyltransferase/mannose-6-phosphate isomerase
MLIPVILSGGAGTRLWPLSRELYPKQLLALTGERTMLQDTALRLSGLEAAAPVVVCTDAHRFLVAEQLRQLKIQPGAIVLEPFGRNTAPAIALAAHAALKIGGAGVDPILLVLPADHVIRDVAAFQAAVRTALRVVAQGGLATFGVVAHTAQTGYGYIRRGAAIGGVHRIAQFVEKPDLERAQAFVASGDYYWNSGMFMFHARRYL